MLFAMPASSLVEQRAVRKGSLESKVKVCTQLASDGNQWLIWCDLNAESDALAASIPGAVNVQGSDSADRKVDALLGFASGRIRVLVTKPSIAGHGMNWQNCNRMAFVGVSHSYEAYYQAIRRCWRFGQKNNVHVHVIVSELEGNVVRNLERKMAEAQRLMGEVSTHTRAMVRDNIVSKASSELRKHVSQSSVTLPSWLKTGR
jgi:superfamily II DNA or RNA helicase